MLGSSGSRCHVINTYFADRASGDSKSLSPDVDAGPKVRFDCRSSPY